MHTLPYTVIIWMPGLFHTIFHTEAQQIVHVHSLHFVVNQALWDLPLLFFRV